MNNKKAIAHFRQLCCLGLSPESIAPALLEALHDVVPSLHNRIAWCDDHRNPSAIYCEAPEMYRYGKLFLEQLDNRLADFPGSRFIFACRPGVGHYLPIVSRPEYFASVYHNEIERPVGGHHFLDMLIADETSTLATIILQRDSRAKPFSREEQRTLELLIPFIAHALRCAPEAGEIASGRRNVAMLLVDAAGKVAHTTDKALQWIDMAFSGDARQGPASSRFLSELPLPIRNLARPVAVVGAGQPAHVPKVIIDSVWGRFRFSASTLREGRTSLTGTAAILIEHQEDRAISLMRGMRALGLSSTQKKVCLALMRSDLTEAQLARCINVSVATVKDHLDKIYSKLDIHSREALVKRLNDSMYAD